MILPNAQRAGPEAAALLIGLASLACHADELAPARFALADREPFSAILGIPDGWVDAGNPRMELTWDVANNAMTQASGDERLDLDGETHTVTLRMQHLYGERLSLGIELPWIAHSGGFLDRAIDSWHEAFGLDAGIRPTLPTGDLQYVYSHGGAERVRLDEATSGVGDLRTSAAFRLTETALHLDLLADAEWPTGDPDRLTGSGGTDLALGLRLARPAGDSRTGWSLTAGLAWPGDVDLPLPPASAQIVYYDAAVAWTAIRSLDLVLQVQGHSGAYRSDLKMLGSSALQLGGGLVWRFGRRLGLRFGIFEDVRTDTTPDFAAQLSLMYLSGAASSPSAPVGEVGASL